MSRVTFFSVVLPLVVFTFLGAAGEEPAAGPPSPTTWPQWRGPDRDGTSGDAPWPEDLDEKHLSRKWRVELSPSYSGPIVSEDRVFVTETVDREREAVHAFDRKTGKKMWSTEWKGALSVPFFAKTNGDWIRATPALDGDRLYVAGMRDVLVCLDTDSGDEIWRLDLAMKLDAPLPAFGFVSSPLVLGEFVYVQAGAGFVKINKRSGEVLWRVLDDGGGMYGSAFSSPFAATIDGTRQILVQTRSTLVGVSPDDGQVFWKREIPAFRGMNVLTPTVAGNLVFTSSYGGKSLMLECRYTDDKWTCEEKWVNKTQGYMSSPVVIDGHIYLHLRNQRLTCIDLATGESKWTTKPFGRYWSMAKNGNKILALDENGELLLIKADTAEFEFLDRRSVGDNSWAHIAVADGEVFIRELNALTAYEWD